MISGSVTVSGYSHVAIDVTDLDAARRFYTQVFGFSELRRPDFGFPGMWLAVGTLQLHFAEVPSMASGEGRFPHFALHVPTEAFDDTIESLRQLGVPFLGDPIVRVDFGTTEVRQAFVHDPAGNIIELTDVGPLAGEPLTEAAGS